MSKEIIEDFIDQLNECEQEEFSEILEGLIYYGFVDDLTLAKLLDLELEDIDALLTDATELEVKTWKSYRVKLRSYMLKEKAKYTRLYYKDEMPR